MFWPLPGVADALGRVPAPPCRGHLSLGRSAAETDPAGRFSPAAQAGAAESQHGQGGAAQPERESLLLGLFWLGVGGPGGGLQQRFQGRGIVNKQSKVSAQHRLLTVCWPAVRLEIPDLRCRFLSSRTFSWDREGLSLMFSVLLHLSLLTPWVSRWHCPVQVSVQRLPP